jgi:hypothetical protein
VPLPHAGDTSAPYQNTPWSCSQIQSLSYFLSLYHYILNHGAKVRRFSDTLVSQVTPHFSLFAGNAILQEIINDS